MKTIKTLIVCLIACTSNCFAGSITGTIQQIVDGQTQVAKGTVLVGRIEPNQGTKLDVMKALGDAYEEKRVTRIGSDGSVSMTSLPEGVPLYISVYLYSGYGKFLQVTLSPGQVLDLSQVIPDVGTAGIAFPGKIVWPAGVTFQQKTSRKIYLSGKNNNWEYVASSDDDNLFQIEKVQPGIYRLGIHSTLANGDDRYDEVEVTVAVGMAAPLLINVP